jgi:hypothetical protein
MMLNNPMDENKDQSPTVGNMPRAARPNEHAGFAVSGFVRVFDPKTQETLVETRA